MKLFPARSSAPAGVDGACASAVAAATAIKATAPTMASRFGDDMAPTITGSARAKAAPPPQPIAGGAEPSEGHAPPLKFRRPRGGGVGVSVARAPVDGHAVRDQRAPTGAAHGAVRGAVGEPAVRAHAI